MNRFSLLFSFVKCTFEVIYTFEGIQYCVQQVKENKDQVDIATIII